MLGWSGMRGAITLAALLAVPEYRARRSRARRARRHHLPGFAVIIVSVIAQGLTLPPLVARLGLAEHPAVAEIERRARLALTRAVLAHLVEADERGDASPELIDGLRAQYVTRRRHLEDASEDSADADAAAQDDHVLRHQLIRLQRVALGEMRRAGEIGITTQRAIEHELDLEEARLSRS